MTFLIRKSLAIASLTTVAALAPVVEPASATCAVGGSGVSYNRSGEAAVFKRLRPMRGMNCPSARYVMNKWLRPAFADGYGRRLPTRFWDGYVTWYCGKLTRRQWRCDEYDSNTSFKFVAYIL